ncbi:hypothetical protein [Accumulibacter sp.]|uniref:hypothetical protein n=1 Tax=Accumulibacter sp. TaxID=2053492 RepID=UPI0025F6575C|nr:hypothetical protein [Accumulibacter sp.]MCM8595564.1 hypothetical protein [Accumulibacter sp.]MCM8625065.1 hypothetical protein [Accumulibacter sp.]MDS4049712.1 hypothetical protein [Accumulibacter sp.]
MHDLLLIVQSRAKGVANFAEKIQRKRYGDPLNEMSDLCGVRVIARTLADVDIVCRYVEQHFEVLPDESDNKGERLTEVEFGYLSRHYEVRFKPGVFPEGIVPPDLVARHLKAEVQVRTILQHAWADIAHDTVYKNSFTLPKHWKRDLHRLAAVLEAADVAFDHLQSGLKEYAASYGAYCDRSELRRRIGEAEITLEFDPHNEAVTHRLAGMAMSLDEWDRAIAALMPFAGTGRPAMLRDLGVSLCKRHADDPEGEAFSGGQDLLRRATEADPANVDAWASLAGTWRTRQHAIDDCAKADEYRGKARALYRQAFELDSSDPYALGNFIEYELAAHPDVDLIPYFRPQLVRAARRCRAQAEVGINMPWAHFDLGKFQMMLCEPYAALAAYALGVINSSAGSSVASALRSFVELQPARGHLAGFDWIKGFLECARRIRFPESEQPIDSAAALPDGPVLVVAGYGGAVASDVLRVLLAEGLADYRGTIVSGGTRAGVCELVGELQAAHPDTLRTIGYLPRELPVGVEADDRYGELRRSAGAEFSPVEALDYWRDIDAAGLLPRTKLIAIGGGNVAAAECVIALALGVPVGVVPDAGGQPAKLLADQCWARQPALLRKLPAEGRALREFLAVGDGAT